MYTEIHIDISHFNEDTKQSTTCQNPEKKHKVFSQLSASLTSVQPKMCWISPNPVLWLLLDAFSTTK